MSTESKHSSDASQREPPEWKWWFLGTILTVVILIAVSLVSPWVRHEWKLSLGRQNTPYTQLAFNNAVTLPAVAVRGKKIQLSFTIVNDEGSSMSYRYVVASGSGAKLETLSSSRKAVASGATWHVISTLMPKCAGSTCRIQVSLPQQNEKIDYMFAYR